MSPSLSLQFNPSVPSAVAGVDALTPDGAGADFMQALQQWLAQIQQPQIAPVSPPQAPTLEIRAADNGRALLASLLAVRQQAGQESGPPPGEEAAAPLTLEMAEDALALLKNVLAGAGDTPAPGIGEVVSVGVKPLADGEELPPGESLPPDALATLSALSQQLEHWLTRAANDAKALDAAPPEKATHLAASQPSPLLAVALASGVPVVPVRASITDAPDGEEAAAGLRQPFTAGLVASLARKTEADALRADAGVQAASSRDAPTPQVPFAGRGVFDTASQSATAPSPTPATTVAGSDPVPPSPLTPAFSAVLDELTPSPAPQAVQTSSTLPDAASAVAAQAVALTPPTAATERPAPPPVATPLGHPGWDAEMGQRVVWMSGNSVSSAEIHLNPPHLGPVEVRISLNQDQQTTNVQFVSPHVAVREALEAAMPKLRDLFGAQQLNLGEVSVSQHPGGQQARSFQQQQQSSPWREAQPEFPLADGAGLAEDGERMRPVRIGQGLLNLYV